MKHLVFAALTVAACAPPSDSPETDSVETDTVEIVDQPVEALPGELPAEERAALSSAITELAECDAALASEGRASVAAARRIDAWGGLSVIEVPCGMPPGTGAYGFPLSLISEWPAELEGLEGTFQVDPAAVAVEFFERDSTGAFASVGYVTQAIPLYDQVGQAMVHLLYKGSGAGQCGLMTTYTSEVPGMHLTLMEARERSCDTPCEDESCADPMNWEQISVWD